MFLDVRSVSGDTCLVNTAQIIALVMPSLLDPVSKDCKIIMTGGVMVSISRDTADRVYVTLGALKPGGQPTDAMVQT